VAGQWQVATAEGRVEQVRLDPPRPRVPEAVLEAIGRADWIIVGPGSWYTSVLPHLMIPEIAEAIRTSPARRCITTNLSVGSQEAEGMTSLDMLEVLLEQAGDCRFDALLADPTTLDDALELSEAAEARGIRTLLRQVSVGDGQPHHDPVRLAAAYRDLFDDAYGDVESNPSTRGDAARATPYSASTADAPSNEEDPHGTDG
ncbi:MAG: gluconeogenesis factor YvcK family protein, partial [Brachybacterium tyrofermentans]